MARRRVGSPARVASAAAAAAGSPAVNSSPSPPTVSRWAPPSAATTGTPWAMASTTDSPKGSAGAGARKTAAPASSWSVSSTWPTKHTLPSIPSSRPRCSMAGRRSPIPATTNRQPRSPSPDRAQAPMPTSGCFSGSSRCIMTTVVDSSAAAGRSGTPLGMRTVGPARCRPRTG